MLKCYHLNHQINYKNAEVKKLFMQGTDKCKLVDEPWSPKKWIEHTNTLRNVTLKVYI